MGIEQRGMKSPAPVAEFFHISRDLETFGGTCSREEQCAARPPQRFRRAGENPGPTAARKGSGAGSIIAHVHADGDGAAALRHADDVAAVGSVID